jgi:hypothetical protein
MKVSFGLMKHWLAYRLMLEWHIKLLCRYGSCERLGVSSLEVTKLDLRTEAFGSDIRFSSPFGEQFGTLL